MKSFKVCQKLMKRSDAPERWTLDIDVNVKRAIVPAGTIGDLKLGYRYAHFVPGDRSLPKISWDSTTRSRLPITPIASDHQAIAPKPIAPKPIACCECGRHVRTPGESFEELSKRTPWWDMAALYRHDPCAPPRCPRLIPAPQNFAAVEIIHDGDLAYLCGECDRRRIKAEKAREKAERLAQETGRKQLALFEV